MASEHKEGTTRVGNDGGSVKHTSGTWTDSPSMPQMHGGSAPQNTSTGSGSRPTKSRFATPTSAPTEGHTLGRAPKGWLE